MNFTNTLSISEIPMSEPNFGFTGKKSDIRNGTWLKLNSNELFSICFLNLSKKETERFGHFSIQHHFFLHFFESFRTGIMLKIAPAEIIPFVKVENELVGTVEIQNIVKHPITYKVFEKKKDWKRKRHYVSLENWNLKIHWNKSDSPKENRNHARD